MPRTTRTDVGEEVYHILNRANARVHVEWRGRKMVADPISYIHFHDPISTDPISTPHDPISTQKMVADRVFTVE